MTQFGIRDALLFAPAVLRHDPVAEFGFELQTALFFTGVVPVGCLSTARIGCWDGVVGWHGWDLLYGLHFMNPALNASREKCAAHRCVGARPVGDRRGTRPTNHRARGVLLQTERRVFAVCVFLALRWCRHAHRLRPS